MQKPETMQTVLFSPLHRHVHTLHSARPVSSDNPQTKGRMDPNRTETGTQHCSAPLNSASSPAEVVLRKLCCARAPGELQVAASWVPSCSVINRVYRSHHRLSGRILRPSGKELQHTLSQLEFMIWSFNSWLQKWLTLGFFIQDVLIPEYGFWKRQTGTQLSTSSKLSAAALFNCFLLIHS